MLLIRRMPARAVFVPVLGTLGAGAVTLVSAAQLARTPVFPAAFGPLASTVVFALITWLFLSDVAVMEARDGRLTVRGFRRIPPGGA